MILITQKDFETKAGQEKIVKAIHNLEYKIHELDQGLQECQRKEDSLEGELSGYEKQEG
jgi:hypothetical protein